ncbi:SigE family RNA polymerase sigma factor [Flindersiella endophytica]
MSSDERFREFVLRRSPSLHRTAYLLTGNWETARDLVQTALARAWVRWSRSTWPDLPELYVRRIMVTTYSNWWRRRWRAEIPTGELPERPDAKDAYAQVDLHTSVRTALAMLPHRQRAIVVLRYFDDLTEAEVARLMGCSIGTVKSQTAKAFAKLRSSPGLSNLLSFTKETT